MFGQHARLLAATQIPAEVENEEALLEDLRRKLGPDPDQSRLLHHLRSARGKVHWAVNSFLREVMSSTISSHLFGCPMPRAASTANLSSGCASAASSPRDSRSTPLHRSRAAASTLCLTSYGALMEEPNTAAAAGLAEMFALDKISATEPSNVAITKQAGVSLDNLPNTVLEKIFTELGDPVDVMAAGLTCRHLLQAACSDLIWKELFEQRWGNMVYPVRPGALPPQSRFAPTDTTTSLPLSTTLAHNVCKAGMQEAPKPSVPFVEQASYSMSADCGTGSSMASTPTAAVAEAATAFEQQIPVSAFLRKQRHTDTDSIVSLSSFPSYASSRARSRSNNSLLSQALQAAFKSMASSPAKWCGKQPGAGAWLKKYGQQLSYARTRSCPVCGAQGGKVVPIMYGFPSQPLLEGMRGKQLILGGDHLIDDCHVWACTTCNASFRSYPYEQPQLWQHEHDVSAVRAEGADADMLPAYTYEL